jgi:putative sterol carrier protein
MTGVFPNQAWLDGFSAHLNSSEDYARIASKWEGDIVFEVNAEAPLEEDVRIYLDLWHGSCREARLLSADEAIDPAFTLTAPYNNFAKIVKGEIDAMQALLTRKLLVKGSMGYMMRNVPTVLEFVNCAIAVTDRVLGDE